MRSNSFSGRAVLALALSLSMPLTSATAASRPAAAVPSAAEPGNGAEARTSKKPPRWALYALAVAAVGAVAIALASKSEASPVSRG